MDVRPWSVRVGQPGMGVVLIVTSIQRLLDPIVERIAAAGVTAFSALPSVADELRRCTAFDRIVWHDEQTTDNVDRTGMSAVVECPSSASLDGVMTDLLVRMATCGLSASRQ